MIFYAIVGIISNHVYNIPMKKWLFVLIPALPLLSAVYHVNPELGKPGASGLSPESALSTVNEALSRCRGCLLYTSRCV